MINQIKDKQTGEYHDIGGLKCKLVAEGKFELLEEGANDYKPIYQFESDKFYAIKVFVEDEYELGCFTGHSTNDLFTTNMMYDASDNLCCLIATKDNGRFVNIFVYNALCETIDIYSGCNYKVYELPFALEV